MKNENDQPGKITPPGEVRIIRTLPGPIERVWDYLVDPAKRRLWFAGGPMEPREGGRVELFFQHKNIVPHEVPPEQFKTGHDTGYTKDCTILRWEPPHVLSFTFDKESDVTFELKPEGEKVLLVVTHRSRGGDLPSLSGFASGWHTLLAQLVALIEASPRPPFWPMFQQMKDEYQKTIDSLKE